MNFVVAIDVVNIHHSIVFPKHHPVEMVLFEGFNVDVKFNDAIDVLTYIRIEDIDKGKFSSQ